jgi:hypothetical protein
MPVPDVVRLVEEARREVELQRFRGELTPEDYESLVTDRLRMYVDNAKIDPKLGARMRNVGHAWNINTEYEIHTPRRGAAGVAVRLAKRAIHPFVKLYTDHILSQQTQINFVFWHFLLDSMQRTVVLELEVKRLRAAIDKLKAHP